jgi:hypothetical protein
MASCKELSDIVDDWQARCNRMKIHV